MILKIIRDSKRAQMLLGLPEVRLRRSSQSEMLKARRSTGLLEGGILRWKQSQIRGAQLEKDRSPSPETRVNVLESKDADVPILGGIWCPASDRDVVDLFKLHG